VPGKTWVTEPVSSIGSSLATGRNLGWTLFLPSISFKINREKHDGQRVASTARFPATDMKNSPLTTFLLVLVAVSALLSIIFCGLYISSSREKHRWETQVEGIKNRNKAVTRLANEVLEYSKHDTNVDAILVWANLKPKPNAAGTNRAGSK
jgi:hypothetical protein